MIGMELDKSKLRQKVVLKSGPSSYTGRGQETGADTTIATRRASVRLLTGNDLIVAQQLHPTVRYEVLLRYESDLAFNERDHLIFGSETLEIGVIENVDQRNRIFRLLCSAVK
jgi:SPP1 family predicted phage head-tail adaptor